MSIFTLAFLIAFGFVMLVTLGLILMLGSGRGRWHRPARRGSDAGGSYGHSFFDSGGSGGGADCGGFDGGGGDCGGGDGGGGGGGD